MLKKWLFAIGLAAAAPAAAQTPMERFASVPAAKPDAELSYGSSPVQGIDVFLPQTRGPHPVLLLIHGGCWRKDIPGREQLRGFAGDVAKRGIAVWSMGYRRADEAGGGYPGMYDDVATAIDRIRSEAKRFNLDLTRSVLAGHSAGGHLALWAAGRGRLYAGSPLWVTDPFMPRTVISLAGVGNLQAAAALLPQQCGPGILEKVTGAPSAGRKEVWDDTSPARLLPNPPAKVLVSGVYDDVVPPYAAMDYLMPLRKAGQDATLVAIPDSGHFEMVTIGTPAYAEVLRRIEAAAK